MQSARTIFSAIIVLATCISSFVYAADRKPDPAAKAEAERLIVESNAVGVWTTDDTGEVTHVQSGMTCGVSAKGDLIQLTKLHVFESATVGGDVDCGYSTYNDKSHQKVGTITLYAFLSQGKHDDDLLSRAIMEIETIHPDWRRAGQPGVNVSTKDRSGHSIQPKTVRYSFSDSSQGDMSSSVWVAAVGDWAVMVRATYPKSGTNNVELISLLEWSGAYLDIDKKANGERQ